MGRFIEWIEYNSITFMKSYTWTEWIYIIVPKIGSMYTHIDFIFIYIYVYIYWITDILDLNIGSEYGSMDLVKFIGKNSWRLLLIPKNQTWPLWGTHMFIHLCWGKRPFFLIGTKLCPLQRGATRSLCCERTAQHLTLPLSRKKGGRYLGMERSSGLSPCSGALPCAEGSIEG